MDSHEKDAYNISKLSQPLLDNAERSDEYIENN